MRPGPVRRGRSALWASVGTVAAVGVVSALVLWAASIGPDQVISGGRPATGTRVPTPTPTPTPLVGPDRVAGQDFHPSEHPVMATLLGLLIVVAVLVVLWMLSVVIRTLVDSIQLPRRTPTPDEVDFEAVTVPRVARAIAEGAAAQRALLQQGTPRNAIVACWHRFEVESSEAGVPKRAWETSAEFTLRILDLVEANRAAVGLLARLYREARFSTHDLDEDARDQALNALDAIHAGLRRSPRAGHP
ncbi:MAG: DUF4129 domain-containing protein [Nocardioidaceae bacterium]